MNVPLTFHQQVCGQVKAGNGSTSTTVPFGGINVILFGDLHQFPPVRNMLGALYGKTNKTKRASVGQAIYHQFETVVTLTEQIRIRDTRWMELLARSREGECTEEDLDILQTLVLTNPDCVVPDFSVAPWNEAILVTPRHSARTYWNKAALHKHCANTGNVLYCCDAEDTIGADNRPLTLKQRVEVAKLAENTTGKLPGQLEFAIGMKAMVLINIAMEADLANRARGEIVDIVLDPREPKQVVNESGITKLCYPPAMLLFKPYHYTFKSLEGLPEGVIPIFPSEVKFNVTCRGKSVKVTRRIPALTAGYAFTDYKSQGQTIEYVIVDLGKPAHGELSGFNAYVALSRSRGRNTIQLLRDFRTDMFTTHPSEQLRDEDDRLNDLSTTTDLNFRNGKYIYD